ncbi:MAG TPA: ROK family transcriptional regulator [Bacteroidales bacterium]|nr:ROK family transcriptional regulator [Bacteroidales bacterium]
MKNEFAKMDAGKLHQANKKMLLKLIKQEGQVSRSELARITGLTPPSITRFVEELAEKDNLVELLGTGNSSGGRPPMMVRFKNEGNYIIGIDLGATSIRGCLVDLNARFLSEIQIPTEINKGFDSILHKVKQLIHKLQNRVEPESKIWGIGMGVAGLVNTTTGVIEHSPDFGWSDVDLRKEMVNDLDIPFFYDNSTRLMALGELYFNSSRGLKNFAVINMGYGIAAGLVIEGNLVRGDKGFAGEFGHINVDSASTVKCHCGYYGCLEALASGHRIAERGKEEMARNNTGFLKDLCQGKPELITAELVANAARLGDQVCVDIYEEITDYLCKGIGILSRLFNPELVYLGGGITENGPFFFEMIHKKLKNYLFRPNSNLQILSTTYSEQATAIGAVSLVLEKIMSLELTIPVQNTA